MSPKTEPPAPPPRGEHKSRQSERQFRAMFDGALDAWVLFDDHGRFVEANTFACKLYGTTREHLLRGGVDLCSPSSNLQNAFKGVRERGHAREECRLVRPDGSVRAVEFAATANVMPGRHLAILRDITERKKVEEDLRESKELLQSVLDNSPAVIYAKDHEGRFLFVNRCFARLFHVDLKQILKRSDYDIFPKEAADAFRVNDLKVLESGRVIEVEEVAPHDDGLHTYISVKFPLYDATGAIKGVCGVSTDITDRKHAEEKLRRSERLLVEAQRVGHIGSWEWDIVSDSLTWSEELYRVYGLPPGQVTTFEKFLERVHPEDRSFTSSVVRRAYADLQPFAYEHRIVRPDGTVRFLYCRGEIEGDDAGKPVRMIGIGQDITDHRMLEEQLRQSQKMEAVGRLAGGIAHDFNNLLTAIMGYGDLLLERMGPRDALHAHLEQIQKAAQRGASLTQQLLAFSRKQVLVPEVLDLGNVVSDLSKMLWRLIGEDVALATLVHPGTDKVRADRGQLAQVLINLSVNARDAMPHGGKLLIEVRNATIEDAAEADHLAFNPRGYVMLAVCDSGAGMDEETRRHIFEPFFTTKSLGQGTGLGLATVYGIVDQSGGHIRVESEPGKGTTFRIYLPRAAASAEDVGGLPDRSQTKSGSETVLLVEDDEMVRRLAREILEDHGYTVLQAVNGEDALRILGRHPGAVQLLLTDVVMPGISGRELAERLLETRPNLKVLYMSGYMDDAIVRRGVHAQGTAFIQKPFSLPILVRKVREVLDAHSELH